MHLPCTPSITQSPTPSLTQVRDHPLNGLHSRHGRLLVELLLQQLVLLAAEPPAHCSLGVQQSDAHRQRVDDGGHRAIAAKHVLEQLLNVPATGQRGWSNTSMRISCMLALVSMQPTRVSLHARSVPPALLLPHLGVESLEASGDGTVLAMADRHSAALAWMSDEPCVARSRADR